MHEKGKMKMRANAVVFGEENCYTYLVKLYDGEGMDKMKLSQKIDKYNSRPIGKADWILLGIMGVFIYLTIFYADLIIIHDHSLTFLDSLFHGDISNFYGNTMKKPSYGFGAVFYWIPYLIQGVWSLPIYILNKLIHFAPDGVKAYLWIKLGICLMLLLATWLIGRILSDFEIGKEKIRFAQFMFLSSVLVMLPAVAISQIDIIALTLMLFGIREYVQSDKITWKFLLIFSFAAAAKTFALFLFLPLVFLKEKRTLYVIWDIFVGFWFILICVIPYAWREDYKESTAVLNDVMIERLFGTQFPAGNVNIPIFAALLIAICIWCYMQNITEKRQLFATVMWVGLFAYAAFFIFVFAHPYWIVLIVPFMILLLTLNGQQRKINMLLELILSVAVMFVYHTKFGVFMTETNIELMVLPKLGLKPNGTGFAQSSEWIVEHGLDFYAPAVFAVFAVCLIAFLVINRPSRLIEGWNEEGNETIRFDHGMIAARLAVILFYIFGVLYFSYWG